MPSAAGHTTPVHYLESHPPGWVGVEFPKNLQEFVDWLVEEIATLRQSERQVTDDELLARIGQQRTPDNDWPLAPMEMRRGFLLSIAYQTVTNAHRWLEHMQFNDQPDRPERFCDFDTADRELSKLLKYARARLSTP